MSADLTLDSIFHPPCSSEHYGDQSLAIATAAPSAEYLRHTEEHSHHGYLLFLPLNTDKKLKISGSLEAIPASALAIVPPDIAHSVMQATGSPAYVAIHIDRDILECEYVHYQTDDDLLQKFALLAGDHGELLSLAHRFMEECKHDLPGKDSVKSALRLQIAHATIRRLTGDEAMTGKLSPDNLGLRRAIIYLESNLEHQVSVAQLAREANMSESTLTRWFKKELDATPADYLTRTRLARARSLLIAGKHSISEIALSCGFGSVAYFSTRFKRHFGCSPSVFRRDRRGA